jgi:NADH-quinone oxidoreductase subunit G
MKALAEKIAKALGGAKRPLVVAGTGCGSEAIIHAAANVVRAVIRQNRDARLCCVVPECNSMGTALMGGMDVEAAAAAVRDGAADTVVILENDLFRRLTQGAARALLDRARHVIVLDHLENETTARADVVFPAATFAESDGTLVNNEGRAQRFFRVFVPTEFSPADSVRESWQRLRDVMNALKRPEAKTWTNLDDVIEALAATVPSLARIRDAAPSAEFRAAGMKVPRQSPRFSGRTSMHAGRDVREHESPDDPDSPFAFSMEGPADVPPPLIARYWSPGWNSVQALNKFQQEVGGPLRGGDPGVRLIGPAPSSDQTEVSFFTDIPGPFTPKDGAFLVVPRSSVFGSEELSSHAPGISARSPRPELALHPADAGSLGTRALVRLTIEDATYSVRVRLDPACARGVASLGVGPREIPYLALPAWGTIRTAADE